MWIAVACVGLDVAPGLASCESLMCYRVRDGAIVGCQNTPNPLAPPRRFVDILHEIEVGAVVARSIEPAYAAALARAGIAAVTWGPGSASAAARHCLDVLTEGQDAVFA